MAQSYLFSGTDDATIITWQYATGKLQLQFIRSLFAVPDSGRLTGRQLAARQAQEKEKTQAQQQL